MYGMDVFMLKKIALRPFLIPETNRKCMSEVLFFPQIAFQRRKAI